MEFYLDKFGLVLPKWTDSDRNIEQGLGYLARKNEAKGDSMARSDKNKANNASSVGQGVGRG